MRKGDFKKRTKAEAIKRQAGKCAYCGIPIHTPWSEGDFIGHAHHLKPIIHRGSDHITNCVYLCEAHHKLLGHGMSTLGIDKQGGSSDTWVQLDQEDFMYWID